MTAMLSKFLSIAALGSALALAWPAQAQDRDATIDRAVASLGAARLQDTDTILGFAAEGAALYESEPVKLSGYQYCSQAVALAEQGDFRMSLRAASKALHLALAGADENLQALALRDLAIVMSYSGDLDKAERFARESLKHPAKTPAVVVGPDLKAIGDAQARRHDYAAAIESYEHAAAESSDRFRPLVMASLANVLIESRDLARARSVLDEVELLEATPSLQAQLDRTRARLLLAEGRPREALAAYQALAARTAGFDSAYYRLWALEGVSNAQLALGDRAAAAAALTQALDSLDQVRAQFRSDEIRMGLFSDLQGLFERAIVLALDRGDARGALEISEKSRARAFLDAVRGRAPVAAAAVGPFDAGALQKALAPDERVLEFHALDDRLVAWVVSRDQLRVVTIPLTRAELGSAVDDYRTAITEGRGGAAKLADQLGARLVVPLGLGASDRLVVVPHGPLHYLPFQALRVDGAWLIERHRVSYAPSASIATQLLGRAAAVAPRMAAFGNPQIAPKYDLPGADKEVAAIATVFPSATRYLRAEATKTRFEQVAPGARLVHVAAHAQADRVDPLRSRVLLANENGQQSFLEAGEVLGLDLSGVGLVTLSACESALGRIANGDEVLGFPRSFLSAGSGALVASLWPVSDEATSLLMSTTYQRLAQGDDVQAALQAGQLAVLKEPRLRHPFFWAPFNLIGNWRLTLERQP